MGDLSKIRINGTLYDLKDATARQEVAQCVNNGTYDSNSKKILLKHGNTVVVQIDATDFIKDGMVSSVVIQNGNLVITFNTDAGQEPIVIPLTDIFNPNNYYTKSQVDDIVIADVIRTQSDATFVNSSNQPVFYLRQASSTLAGLMTSAEHNKLSDLPSNSELTQTLNGKVGIVDNGAYDVTVHNSNATFASLQALLNSENLSTLIPTDVRKGGMSIKFVQSSDNKYVQFTYLNNSIANADFINVKNWVCSLPIRYAYAVNLKLDGNKCSWDRLLLYDDNYSSQGILTPYSLTVETSTCFVILRNGAIQTVITSNDIVSSDVILLHYNSAYGWLGGVLSDEFIKNVKAVEGKISQVEEHVKSVERQELYVSGLNYDKNASYLSKYIRHDNGLLVDTSNTFTATDYINVEGLNYIYYTRIKRQPGNHQFGMAFYSDKSESSYISGQQIILDNVDKNGYTVEKIAVPEGAKYARFTTYTDTDSFGVFIISGSDFSYRYEDDDIIYVPADFTLTSGKSINATTGELMDSNDYSATDYIDIYEDFNKILYKNINRYQGSSLVGMAFYDTNKNFISGAPAFCGLSSDLNYVETSIFIPKNAKYARFTTITTIPFSLRVIRESYNSKYKHNSDSFNEHLGVINIGSPVVYSSQNTGSENLDSLTTTQMYSLYDALVSQHPNLFVRISGGIGETDQDQEIARYQLKMQNPWIYVNGTNEYQDSYYHPKLFVLTSGIHGNEHSAVYGLYLAVKELLESTEEWAVYLKSNFEYEILPVLNPYGFDNLTGENANNVNLNRDFEDATQTETQLILAFLNSIKQDIHAVIDMHNTGLKRGYLVSIENTPYYKFFVKTATKIACAKMDSWATLIDDSNAYPYFCMWANKDQGQMHAWAAHNGLIGNSLECPLNKDGRVPGTGNNSEMCKMTKEALINLLQMYGQI